MTASMKRHQVLLFSVPAVLLGATGCQSQGVAGTSGAGLPPGYAWKTAYYKRGFMGNYKTEWGDGAGATLRIRVPMPFAGSGVRVLLQPGRDIAVGLSKMTFIHGADDEGKADGKPYQVQFGGAATLAMEPGAAVVTSDVSAAPITRGTWYLQQSYSSPQYLYFYDKDAFFSEAGDRHDAATLAHRHAGAEPGNSFQVDVLTTDKRPTIACYGDSITQGYNSTPNKPVRYPDVLGKLLDLPTLNLGVNGDVISQAYGGAGATIRQLSGVKTVILLMGINDIIGGRFKRAEDYARIADHIVADLHSTGLKVYLGTILPAAGNPAFDKNPENEPLRVAINTWLKAGAKADGIIDFDAALADPAHPEKMLDGYQSDHLHPSDAGYQRMAETAAGVLKMAK